MYCNPLSTKGKLELVAKWEKENVSDLVRNSVGLMSQWARLRPCFFCNASMPFHPGSPVSLEWWFYFAREFGWFIVLSQSTDPLTPLPRIEGWSVSQFHFMKIYNMKGNIFKCPQPFWWISILGISNVITVYIWKILTKKVSFCKRELGWRQRKALWCLHSLGSRLILSTFNRTCVFNENWDVDTRTIRPDKKGWRKPLPKCLYW